MAHLADYYRDRAAEYDAVYTKPERQDALARLHDLLPRLVAGSRVLEIAAGTGYWTRTLSGSASAITGTDINVEALDLARAASTALRRSRSRSPMPTRWSRPGGSSTSRSSGSSGPTSCAPTCRGSAPACMRAFARVPAVIAG